MDYLTYLDGPNALMPDPRPRVLPSLAGGDMTGEQMMFLRRHMRLLFWHAADDNFDGRIDALVVGTRENRSGWIDGHILVRSTHFDGRFEQCRYAPLGRSSRPATCQLTDQGYTVPGRSLTGLETVRPDHGSRWFEVINKAARQCGRTSRHFRSQ